jgi:hypothetical protein
MVGMCEPEYPIRVFFKEDGETWVLENEEELVNNLEWFDSDSSEEYAVTVDNQGRAVRVKVEKLELIVFKLK